MKSSPSRVLALVLSLALLMVAGCATSGTSSTNDQVTSNVESIESTDSTEVSETAEPGSWVPDTNGPWDGSLRLAYSSDGLTFEGDALVLEQSGVPNLLLRDNGDLVLTYQYFSFTDESLFDVIAYSVSSDEGATWTDTQPILFEGLPEPIDADKNPMDPTLVETEDGALRLYFTYHAQGNVRPALYSALAADGDLASPFVVEPEPALMIEDNLLDPAVVYFDGQWHHYTWQDTSDENIHSVSEDGITFTRQDDITLPMDFLGQVIAFDGGLKFYGTSAGGVTAAISTDGTTWTMEKGPALQGGADPGVQALADGTYVMVYTSMNFNQ